MASSSQPKFHHDNNNSGKSQYQGSATNTTKWKYTTMNSIDSSPAIGSDGTIYIGSDDGRLYAINSNGTLKWQYTTGTGNYIDTSPAISSDGTIYIGSVDNNLYAINLDGTLKWKWRIC